MNKQDVVKALTKKLLRPVELKEITNSLSFDDGFQIYLSEASYHISHSEMAYAESIISQGFCTRGYDLKKIYAEKIKTEFGTESRQYLDGELIFRTESKRPYELDQACDGTLEILMFMTEKDVVKALTKKLLRQVELKEIKNSSSFDDSGLQIYLSETSYHISHSEIVYAQSIISQGFCTRGYDSKTIYAEKIKTELGIEFKQYLDGELIFRTESKRPYQLGQACDSTIDCCVMALFVQWCEENNYLPHEIHNRAYPGENLNATDFKYFVEIADLETVANPQSWDKEEYEGLLTSLTEINCHYLVQQLEELTDS